MSDIPSAADAFLSSKGTAAQSSSTFRFWLVIAAVAGPLLLFDLAAYPVLRQTDGPDSWLTPAMFGCFGVALGQGTLLAVAHVLGPGTLWMRSLLAWAGGFAAMGTWYLGYAAADSDPDMDAVQGISCMVPFFVLAVESPLWLMRLTRNWRLDHEEATSDSSTSIANLFSVTALVAVTFGLAQIGRAYLVSEIGSRDWFWPAMGIAWLVLAAASTVLLSPLLIFRMKWRRWDFTLGWAVLFPGIAVHVCLAIVEFMDARWNWYRDIMPLGIIATSVSSVLWIGLTVLAHGGWFLASARPEPK
jgi:hypothetical protein